MATSTLRRPFAESVAGFMLEAFLFGINIMLFSATIYILVWKSKGISRWPLLASAAIMFSVAAGSACMSIYVLFGLIMDNKVAPVSIIRSRRLFLLINYSVADVLLIYRCYVIWAYSISIIAAPCVLFIGTTVWGIVVMSPPVLETASQKYVYLWLTLFLSISVTTLIATRIWWMAYQACKTLGPVLASKYYPSLTIMIESGAIYSCYVLLEQILTSTNTPAFPIDMGLVQVAAIAPTLIIVQLGLGRHVRDVETTIRRSRERTVILSTVHSDDE